MNKIKVLIFTVFIFCAVLLTTSCVSSSAPYEGFDKEGYTVSVKFDANGGSFATGTTVITDTFNPEKSPVDDSGNKYISLISPSDPLRGENNHFTPSVPGCFLAGWYSERTPVLDADGNHLDVFGGIASVTGKQPAYTYSGRWDFENGRLVLEDGKEYSSEEPAITLYAGWAPKFAYEFYSVDGALLGRHEFTPSETNELALPAWDSESGRISMGKFPSVDGKTFTALYLNTDKSEKVDGDAVIHTGVFDYDTAKALNPTMKLYMDFKDGAWYKITTAKQFVDIKDREGSYEILADLDFTGLNWPTVFTGGTFTGNILGNGHKFSNIANSNGEGVLLSNTSSSYGGLFGQIASASEIKDIAFENVTVKIESGTKNSFARYGLIAGLISDGAKIENVSVTDSVLQISNRALFPTDSSIGLFAGIGTPSDTVLSGIRAEALNESEYKDILSVTVNGNDITVSYEKRQ